MTESLKDSSDANLLDSYCAGDEEAFRELVDRYKNGLYAFLRQFLNQHDLVEDVFHEPDADHDFPFSFRLYERPKKGPVS